MSDANQEISGKTPGFLEQAQRAAEAAGEAGVGEKDYSNEWLKSKRFDPEDATALAEQLGIDVEKVWEARKLIMKAVLGMIDRGALNELVRLEKLGRKEGKVYADDWLKSERWEWPSSIGAGTEAVAKEG